MPHGQEEMLPYLYPPYAAFFFAPFVVFPFTSAFWLWSLCSIGAYCIGTIVWSRVSGWTTRQWSFLAGGLGFLTLPYLLLLGQSTTFAFLVLVLALSSFQRDRDGIAGMWIGLLAIKPQLCVALGLVILGKARWLAVRSAGAVVAVLIFIPTVLWGAEVWVDWVRLLTSLELGEKTAHVTKIGSMTSLRGWFSLTTSWGPSAALGASALVGLPIIGATIWCWRGAWQPRSEAFAWSLTATLLCMLLIAPHSNLHMTFLLWIGALWISAATRTTWTSFCLITIGSMALLLVFSVKAGPAVVAPLLFVAWVGSILQAERSRVSPPISGDPLAGKGQS
jgi:hypothetical protein